MKFSIKSLIGDDSNEAWEWFGAHDPYYGVLSGKEYRKGNLSVDRYKEFFDTGRSHVDRVFLLLETHFGVREIEGCLDFGCGVGRLVVPFAARVRNVVGVDVSSSMLEEAKRNCTAFGVGNVRFVSDLNGLEEKFDLVHSYIVLQHVPKRIGLAAIDLLIMKARPGGMCFLHFTIGWNAGFFKKIGTFLRKNIKPLHYVLNLREGKTHNEAYMRSTEYNLNALLSSLFDKGIKNFWIESENHGGPYSVSVLFKVPQ